MPTPNFCLHRILDHIFISSGNEKPDHRLIETIEINARKKKLWETEKTHKVGLEKSSR